MQKHKPGLFGPRPKSHRLTPKQVKAVNARTIARNFGLSPKRKRG